MKAPNYLTLLHSREEILRKGEDIGENLLRILQLEFDR
jgi:hypothetical protein